MQPHGSIHTHTAAWEQRTEKQTESDSSILLNITLEVGCIFYTNLLNIILALILFTIGDDSCTHCPFLALTCFTHQYILMCWSAKPTNTRASTHTVCNLRNLSILLSLSVDSQQEFVARMVSLPGTRPHVASKKCQLSLNAATEIYHFLCLSTGRKRRSLPNKRWFSCP